MSSSDTILNRLLDKYARSSNYAGIGKSNRRVMLNIGDNDFPEYDYQDAQIRDDYNRSFESLESSGILGVEWLPGRNRQVAQKIWLNLDNVMAAYEMAGRCPEWIQAEELADKLKDKAALVRNSWLSEFLSSHANTLLSSKKLTAICKKDYFADLMTALELYDTLDENGITMRAFSIHCYHDSKHFEQYVRDAFLSVMRQHHPGLKDVLEDNELSAREQLTFLGIFARPELYELSGPVIIETDVGRSDISSFAASGIAVPSTARIQGFHMANVRRVLFIENKTCYDEYLIKRGDSELIVYHGGFLSAQKRKLFEQLSNDAEPNTKFMFWGDIDLGGFKMFCHLKRTVPSLQPWKMCPDEVERYHEKGLARTTAYWEKLKALLSVQEYVDFSDVIQSLLKYESTIEQEVMLDDLDSHM